MEDKETSNEEYWMIHERGEEFRRKRILFVYPTRKLPHDSLCFGWPDVMLIEALDEKQKAWKINSYKQRFAR